MQSPSEADAARRAALVRRAQAHAAWKSLFFAGRPAPPPLPKSRPPRERIAAAPTHALLKRAREIAAAEAPKEKEKRRVNGSENDNEEDNVEVAKDKEEEGHGAVVEKGAAWRRQMRAERERRNPFTDVKIISVPSRTVIVAGLHSRTAEEDIRLFGEQFGRVVRVRLVRDRTGSSRRYGFVQFGLETEAQRAVAQSRRRRLHGRPVVVDVERGRTDPQFLPARLAQAQRVEQRCKGTGAPESRKADANEDKEKKEGKVRKVNLFSAPESAHTEVHDEVDALLNDIMNIT